jgi:hypothetical protein
MTPVSGAWPRENVAALNAFYGDPRGPNGAESPTWAARNLTLWIPPYPMFYSDEDRTPLHRLRVHKKCIAAFDAAFKDVLGALGHEYIKVHRLDVSGGTFCYRVQRGGSRLSVHSWGCAIDLDPAHNPFPSTHGPMDLKFVEILNRHGFWWRGSKTGLAAGTGTDTDFMHFQLCRHSG